MLGVLAVACNVATQKLVVSPLSLDDVSDAGEECSTIGVIHWLDPG